MSSGDPPGPATTFLPADIRRAIIDHARAGYPNEACGLIIGDGYAADGGLALRFEPTSNKAASPYRYEIDPTELLRLTIATDDAGEVFWGIVPLAYPLTGAAVADRYRARFLPGFLVRARVLERGRGGPGDRRAGDTRVADPRRRGLRGGPRVSPEQRPSSLSGLGALAVVAATLVGQDPARLDAIVKPPALSAPRLSASRPCSA